MRYRISGENTVVSIFIKSNVIRLQKITVLSKLRTPYITRFLYSTAFWSQFSWISVAFSVLRNNLSMLWGARGCFSHARSIAWQWVTFMRTSEIDLGHFFDLQSPHTSSWLLKFVWKNKPKKSREGISEIRSLFENFLMYSSAVNGRIVPLSVWVSCALWFLSLFLEIQVCRTIYIGIRAVFMILRIFLLFEKNPQNKGFFHLTSASFAEQPHKQECPCVLQPLPVNSHLLFLPNWAVTD